jgi:hypothetical protein
MASSLLLTSEIERHLEVRSEPMQVRLGIDTLASNLVGSIFEATDSMGVSDTVFFNTQEPSSVGDGK